jgi:hypothetical protein
MDESTIRIALAFRNKRMIKTKFKILQFLTRRSGGLEAELMIAACELWWGLSLTLDPLSLEQTRGLSDFFWSGWSSALIGSVWVIVAATNILGIGLFFLGRPECAWVRFWGSFFSSWIWSSMFIKTGLTISWFLPASGIYIIFGLWSARLMFAAFMRSRHANGLV